jgi:hypothetical protein
MSPDFRSDKSESFEGKGIARRTWEAYARRVNAITGPMLRGPIRHAGATETADMLGFWLLWHLYGGFEGLEEIGMHRSTIFRKVKRFRTYFKVHPDEYKVPGVTLDPETFWKAFGLKGHKR